ncbi:DsbA family oxidoreductase [Plantactinospora sp. KLBMP9567]|uniref:DsbA family oxidoreductase n=1 Tax=Plantactinospora sp. KLBMP9567 TaxID=3085900 RepID=UPI002982A21B|nr:DsbA family oxidoreductase [Plantactinospora sp. KLBMP9567]MDW5325211.1 DsbA family oxidoreductase [Plantactinospora sp. KLBMP9567]
MQLEVWSDIVCPWCYLGKRRLETALGQFEYADEVEVVWRSFQLDPSYPKGEPRPVPEALRSKLGASAAQVAAMQGHVTSLAAEEGLDYHLDQSIMANTFDAHRLTHLAREYGLGAELHERLMRANLIEAENVDDPETLVRLATEVGVPAEAARRVLAGDEYATDVEADIAQARAFGANGVPFFVLDRRYGISGAQPTEAFLSALRTAHQDSAAGAR